MNKKAGKNPRPFWPDSFRKDAMRARVSFLLLALVLACAAGARAQQQAKGDWRAASRTAAGITGDISFSTSKISINFVSYPISPVRLLKPAEVAAAFDEAIDTAGNGQLYRINIPAARRFLKHNTLCGTQDTQWMATYVANGALDVAYFSGDDPPLMTFEALQSSTDLCGTFTYVR
jgi:hypothetical protein